MARREIIPGWTRISQNEFKAAITVAMATEPDLCHRLRLAIIASAGRRVPTSTLNLYLAWVAEVEAATSAMAEARAQPQPVGALGPSERSVAA